MVENKFTDISNQEALNITLNLTFSLDDKVTKVVGLHKRASHTAQCHH